MKANSNCAQGAYVLIDCSLATGGILNPTPRRRQSFNKSLVWRHTLQRRPMLPENKPDGLPLTPRLIT